MVMKLFFILRKAVQPMTIKEVQAMNQRLIKARGVGKVSDIDMKRARENFYEHGGTSWLSSASRPAATAWTAIDCSWVPRAT